MGKKAVGLLFYALMVAVMLLNIVFTIIAMQGSTVSPEQNGFVALMALALPVLLIVNLGFVIYWVLRLRWWFVLPLAMLVANYRYYPSIYQIRCKADLVTKVNPAQKLRVAQYNINYFSAGQFSETISEVAWTLRDRRIDVVCFQEFAHNKEFTPDSMARIFGLPYFSLGHNSEGYEDLAIFSRYPLSNAHSMIFQKLPSSAMWADMNVKGQSVRIFTAHMQSTSINQEKGDLQRQLALAGTVEQARAAIRISNIMKYNFRRRAAQAHQITAAIDTASMPVIFCVDANDTPSSYVYNTLTTGKQQLVDGFKESGKGYAYTFRSMKKLLRIDYIFHSRDLKAIEYVSPNQGNSDHDPVFSTILLPPARE